MHFPKLPDWLIYGAVVSALLVVAIGRQERPTPAAAAAGAGRRRPALGPASPFDPSIVVQVPEKGQPGSGTAFSVDDGGSWLTARHVVDGCREAAIVVADGRGVAARVTLDPAGDAAILDHRGRPPPPCRCAPRPNRPRRGERAYHPGFPQGHPGEVTSRLLGRENLVIRGRAARVEPVLVWAEVGRTDNRRARCRVCPAPRPWTAPAG